MGVARFYERCSPSFTGPRCASATGRLLPCGPACADNGTKGHYVADSLATLSREDRLIVAVNTSGRAQPVLRPPAV